MRSLGWRKGFKVTDEYSALGDEELMARISERLKRLLQVIDGNHEKRDAVDKANLEDQIEELTDDFTVQAVELAHAKRRIEKLEKVTEESVSFNGLLSRINDILSEVYHDDFEDLESAVGALIEEYDDLREETEDED